MSAPAQLPMPWMTLCCAELARILGVSWRRARTAMRRMGHQQTSMRGVRLSAEQIETARAALRDGKAEWSHYSRARKLFGDRP